MARSSLVGLALALGLAGACEGRANEAPRCELSPSHVVAQADAARFDAIALDAVGGRSVLAWSEPGGAYVRALDGAGRPAGEPVRIGAPCTGGLDVELGAQPYVGCSRRGEDDSEVVLVTLDGALQPVSTLTLGRAGRDGDGIDVEAAGDTVYALFHDGSVGLYTIELAAVRGGRVAARTLSRRGRSGSEPALFVEGGSATALFAESDYETPGKVSTELVAVHGDGAPHVLRRVAVTDPAPRLARDAKGLVLTFRDRPGKERRPELYAARISPALRLDGEPVKVGRANTEGAPTLVPCGGLSLGVMPREYGGERYIAVHALGAALENLTGGHQFYANSRDFVLASAACTGGTLLVAAGERRTPADRGVAVETVRFACR